MKRAFRFVVTVLMICLAGMGAASAVTMFYGNDVIDFQIGLDTVQPSTGFYSRGERFGTDYEPTSGSEYVWSVFSSDTNAPSMTITAEGSGRDSRFAWLNLDSSVSYTAGTSYSYTVQADMNGMGTNIVTRTVTVNFVDNPLPVSYGLTVSPVTFTDTAASLGTAVDVVNGKLYTQTKNTYAVIANIDVGQSGLSYMANYRDWDGNAWTELYIWDDTRLSAILDSGKSGVYTAKKPGVYEGNYHYTASFYSGSNGSNIACRMPFAIYVTDENGKIPSSAPNLVNWNWMDYSADVMDYPVYTGLPFEYGDSGSTQHLWQDSNFANIFIDNWSGLESEYGGTPAWSVVSTPSDLDFRVQYGNDNHQIWCYLNSAPTQNYTVTVTCTWGGESASKTISIYPDSLTSMPTGISGVSDEVNTQVGQTLTLEPSVLPGGWTHTAYSGQYFCAQGLRQFADQNWNGNPFPDYGIHTAGIFTDEVGLRYGPLMITRTVTFKVADASGNVPTVTTPQLTVTAGSDYNVYLGMPRYYGALGADGDLPYGSIECLWAEIPNYNDLKSYYGTEPDWTYSIPDSAPFTVTETAVWENSFNLWPSMDVPAVPMDVPVTFTCKWGDQTATATVTLHYVDLPSGGVPTDHDYPTEVHLKVGDTFTIAPDPVPAGWSIPNYTNHVVVFDEEMEAFAQADANNRQTATKTFTATKAGTYIACVMLSADTVYMGHNVVFYVADENGNVPAPMLELYDSCGSVRDYYIGNGLVLSDEIVLNQPYTDSYIDDFTIYNYAAYASLLNGSPQFTVTCSDPGIQFKVSSRSAEQGEIRLDVLPTAAKNVTFHVECNWDGAHGEMDIEVYFTWIDMPTGLYRGADNQAPAASLTVRRYDRLWEIDMLHLANDCVPERGTNGEYNGSGMWYNEGDEHAEDHWALFVEQGNDFYRIADEVGSYDITLSSCSGNITWTQACHLVIEDRPFLTLPGSVKTIESQAFAGSGAEVIVIPAGCESIAVDAFDGCAGLVCVINRSGVAVNAPAGVTVLNE